MAFVVSTRPWSRLGFGVEGLRFGVQSDTPCLGFGGLGFGV